MYVGIDIGGTKTLVATLSDDGVILSSRHFLTPFDYKDFLHQLKENLGQLELSGEVRCAAAVPGLLDREAGRVKALGNLPWVDKPIRDDIAKLLGHPLLIENDSRLAGLSEARLVRNTYSTVFFATISTGIGGAFVKNGRIVTDLQDMEIGKMPLMHHEEFMPWEEFASGRSVTKRFNKQAKAITDPDNWREIGEHIAWGLAIACSILQPEAIILGGSVGKYADRYSPVITSFLAKHLHPVVHQPKAVLAAQRPDEAVIYGCYELAKQVHTDAKAHH